MKFFNNYPNDDLILKYSVLLLLPFINCENYIIILCVIFSNLIYWSNKNIYTFSIDSFFAILFIIYILYKCYIKKINYLIIFISLCVLLYYFDISSTKGRNGERQIYEHLIFRFIILMLFYLSI